VARSNAEEMSMPQDQFTGQAGREFGVGANWASARRFKMLAVDDAHSDHQKVVLRDGRGARYWLKNGRSNPTMSEACLKRYEYVIIEDRNGTCYLMAGSAVLAHPEAKPSESTGHARDRNPHAQLAMRHVRVAGSVVAPETFAGEERS
jgi:hypothetical protein